MSYAKHPGGGAPSLFPKWNYTDAQGLSDARSSLCRGTACRARLPLECGGLTPLSVSVEALQRRGGGGPGDVVSLEEGFGVGDGDGGALGEAGSDRGPRGGFLGDGCGCSGGGGGCDLRAAAWHR